MATSGDIVYVTLFPQLLLVVHYESGINARGSQIGFLIAVVLRILGGESSLGVPAAIKYPGYDCKTQTQNFPFKTFTMLCRILAEILELYFSF